jgi:restriction system protein
VRYFSPLVDALKELGGSARPAEVKRIIATNLSLPDEVLNQRNKSGLLRFSNDVDWARFYLVNAGYVDASARGVWSLSDKGYEYALSHEEAVELFKAIHKEFVLDRKTRPSPPEREAEDEEADEEVALAAETSHRDAMLGLLRDLPAAGFERLCQRILREAGFESVTVTGRTGDGGLDGIGILQVNPLVSFKVLFQCKRYTGDVTPSQVRDFRGAMQGRADKGIILTTGTFSPQARNEALREGVPPIELVDAEKLLDMLEDLQLGFKPKRAFDIDEAFLAQFK